MNLKKNQPTYQEISRYGHPSRQLVPITWQRRVDEIREFLAEALKCAIMNTQPRLNILDSRATLRRAELDVSIEGSVADVIT